MEQTRQKKQRSLEDHERDLPGRRNLPWTTWIATEIRKFVKIMQGLKSFPPSDSFLRHSILGEAMVITNERAPRALSHIVFMLVCCRSILNCRTGDPIDFRDP